MATSLSLLAPAKLNLFLHITGRRPDGYHELQTLFQLLDWGDRLRFTVNPGGRVTLDDGGLGIPVEGNLAYRAAKLLHRDGLGVHIELDKRVPTGGGLGGGSSDAGATLLALNRLWALGMTGAQLQRLGATLGADVPVFVAGHTAWAEGIGERLTPLDLPERWYLVISPDCHISTREIFSHPELTRNTSPIKIAAFFEGNARNDCQALVRKLYPPVDKALTWLENFGDARLTGTGASIFAGFDSERAARAVLQQVPAPWRAVVARGLNRSPVLASLAN